MSLLRLASSRLISVAVALSVLVGMLVYSAQLARAAEDRVDDLLGILGVGGSRYE